MILWNENLSMEAEKQAITNQEKFFTDKDTAGGRPQLGHMEKDMSIHTKQQIVAQLRENKFSGCLGTNSVATGLDVPFAAVSFSRLGHDLTWDEYVHTSGRCGRRPNQLGVSNIYIYNDEDARKWEGLFKDLLEKQPDLCERVGVVRVGNPPPNSTFESFFGHVGPLRIGKPSSASFSIEQKNLTDRHEGMSTVAKLFETRKSPSPWPKNSAAAASAAPVSPPMLPPATFKCISGRGRLRMRR